MATIEQPPSWDVFTEEIGFSTLNIEGQAFAQKEWLAAKDDFINTLADQLSADTTRQQASLEEIEARGTLYNAANERNTRIVTDFVASLSPEVPAAPVVEEPLAFSFAGERERQQEQEESLAFDSFLRSANFERLINEGNEAASERDLTAIPDEELSDAEKVGKRLQLHPRYGFRFLFSEGATEDSTYSVNVENSPRGNFLRVTLPDQTVVREPIEDSLVAQVRLQDEADALQEEIFNLETSQEAAIETGSASTAIAGQLEDKEKELKRAQEQIDSNELRESNLIREGVNRALRKGADSFPSQNVFQRAVTDLANRNTKAFLGAVRGVNLLLDKQGVEDFAQRIEGFLEAEQTKDLRSRLSGGVGEFGRQLASEGLILASDILMVGGAAKAVATRAGAQAVLSRRVPATLLGVKNGFTVANDEYSAALAETGDKGKAATAYLGAFALNTALEAVAFDKLFDLAGTTRSIRKVVKDLPTVDKVINDNVLKAYVKAGGKGALKQASTEVATELLQEIGTNAWALQVYDENRKVFDAADLSRTAAMAAILGGASGAISSSVGENKLRTAAIAAIANRDNRENTAKNVRAEVVNNAVKQEQVQQAAERGIILATTAPAQEGVAAAPAQEGVAAAPAQEGVAAAPAQEGVAAAPAQEGVAAAPAQEGVAAAPAQEGVAAAPAQEGVAAAPAQEGVAAAPTSEQSGAAAEAAISNNVTEQQATLFSSSDLAKFSQEFRAEFENDTNAARSESEALFNEANELKAQAKNVEGEQKVALTQQAQEKEQQAQEIINKSAQEFLLSRVERQTTEGRVPPKPCLLPKTISHKE